MFVVTRYRVPPAEQAEFAALGRVAVEVLAARPGCRQVRFGRNVDEPELWVLSTGWDDVGSYRRALSHPAVKAGAVPLMYRCIDEPTAFEDLITWTPGEGVREQASDLA
jgi:quinol monooxygenase YgiN